jgi:HD domain
MSKRDVARVVQLVSTVSVCLALSAAASWDTPEGPEWVAAGFFFIFGTLASLLGYQTTQSTSGTIGFLPFLSIALIAPNAAALLAVIASVVVSEVVARKKIQKVLFNTSQQLLAEVAAIALYRALGGQSILNQGPPVSAFLAMVVVFFVVNKLAVSAVVAADKGGKTKSYFFRSMRGSAVYDVFAFPLILLFSVAYREFGPSWSAAFALPMLGLRQLYKQNFALQKINEELLQLMVAAIEARDPYTSGHSQRVQRYARFIATTIGIGSKQTERIATAALLHDVGKIHEEFAPILRKSSRLTDEEFAVMTTHPDKGATLVGKVSHFADLVPIIQAHHEAWDGAGYPRKLRNEDIPVGARVIALADTIDAMCSTRPYRAGLSPSIVRAEISKQSGRQYDPLMCEVLLKDDVWAEMEREIVQATIEFPEAADPSYGVESMPPATQPEQRDAA